DSTLTQLPVLNGAVGPVNYPRALIETAGDGLKQFRYVIEDRAGNRGVSDPVAIDVRLEVIPVPLRAMINLRSYQHPGDPTHNYPHGAITDYLHMYDTYSIGCLLLETPGQSEYLVSCQLFRSDGGKETTGDVLCISRPEGVEGPVNHFLDYVLHDRPHYLVESIALYIKRREDPETIINICQISLKYYNTPGRSAIGGL
ncbi:hypothetical protein, partial [Burkholderia ubonensis]|uniref:hypothetical protein n=1 Tax=Burkholderia ubonensis TaxID=101571 RepID=UPI000AC64CF5